MKNHTKVYINSLYYDVGDFIPCEVCNTKAVDIHHIFRRGMGGSRDGDKIENLMALCRTCHEKYGDKKQYRDWLQKIHDTFIFNKLK